jgi:hypothetical protein
MSFTPLEDIIKLILRGGDHMNLIERIYEEMTTDSDSNDKQAEILKNEYTTATVDQQKAIDRVFIALCGWSLKTLIEGHAATESYNPYA